ncbi:tetratricopeptide repeat protein [bacterium]|nr:tetratricopeptide repeat protein [bacterium]
MCQNILKLRQKINGNYRELGIFLIGILCFLPSLQFDFVYDDIVHISQNLQIRSLANTWEIFTTAIFPGNLFRPLVQFSHALTYAFSGMNPFFFHLINLLLHASIAVLVYQLFCLFFHDKLALVAGILFAVLPIHTEAVVNISGRAELFVTYFGLLVLLRLAGNKPEDFKAQLTTASLFCFALLSKESAVVLLALALLLDYYRGLFRPGLYCLVFGLPLLVYFALRYFALGALVETADIGMLENPLIQENLLGRISNGFYLLSWYLSLTLAPVKFSADYSYATILPFRFGIDLPQTLVALSIAAIFAVTIYAAKLKYEIAFFSAWFFLSFTITANILFPIGTIFAERLAYLPSIGIVGLLAYLITRVSSSRVQVICSTLLCALYATVALAQAQVWRDELTLRARQVEITPQSAKALHHYGEFLRREKKLTAARELMLRSLQIYPRNPEALCSLAAIYFEEKNYQQALIELEKSKAIDHMHARTYDLKARSYLMLGDKLEALKNAKRAVELAPGDFPANLVLAGSYLALGDLNAGISIVKQLKMLNPEDPELQSILEQLNARGIMIK